MNETFSAQRPRDTESLSGTFSLEENAQGEGRSRDELARTFLHQCHTKEPHYCQLPKGWTFWGVESFKPAQLPPLSCHLPKSQHPPAAQAIIPWGPDKMSTFSPVAMPKSAAIAWFGWWITPGTVTCGTQSIPGAFQCRGSELQFLLDLLPVMLQLGLCLLLLLCFGAAAPALWYKFQSGATKPTGCC